MDVGGRVDVIYTDFSKAFDKVNHDILLKKLNDFNFTESFICFLSSYLKNRSQFVVVANSKSKMYSSTSGVPQGSNLGPLLFLIFINDLPTCFTDCKCLLYADDLKIYKSIKNNDDIALLQLSLDRLMFWCDENDLFLNVKKCFVVSYSRRKEVMLHNYTINGTVLTVVKQIKDLGVIFESTFRFDTHISSIISSAYRMLGFIIRNTKLFSSVNSIMRLYCFFVRSKLEYCTIIWDPFSLHHIKSIELVQNKFLRYLYFKRFHVTCIRDFSTTILRSIFSINSLEARRNSSTLMFLFNVFHNLIDSRYLLAKIQLHIPRNNLRSSLVFFVPKCNTVQYYNISFFKAFRYLNLFKNEIDLFNANKYSFKGQICGVVYRGINGNH